MSDDSSAGGRPHVIREFLAVEWLLSVARAHERAGQFANDSVPRLHRLTLLENIGRRCWEHQVPPLRTSPGERPAGWLSNADFVALGAQALVSALKVHARGEEQSPEMQKVFGSRAEIDTALRTDGKFRKDDPLVGQDDHFGGGVWTAPGALNQAKAMLVEVAPERPTTKALEPMVL